ncbi:bifunctional apoptosis regulator-like [Oscarella lobularis]|uniref:bifunctional apoptosis regulator-like n=1 Tax=Oscarella lobularis TaxID=121494 RepID=UPI003313CA09
MAESTRENFICGCCMDLMVDATTLTCGHSFCRACLARWWSTQRKTICLTCRQPWQGHPQVNTALRNAIENLYADEMHAKRETLTSDSETTRVLREFEQNSRPTRPNRPPSGFHFEANVNGNGNGGKLCLLIAGLIVLWLFSSESEGSAWSESKPHVYNWNTDEVVLWMKQIGDWTEPYIETFRNESINGKLLLRLTDDDLRELGVMRGWHRSTILDELSKLQNKKDEEQPNDLWEFKDRHPKLSMWTIVCLHNFPRAYFLYSYTFHYDEVYIPFLHSIASKDTGDDKNVTDTQLIADFWFKVLVVPYYLIGVFAWNWIDVTPLNALLIVAYAACRTISHATSLRRTLNRLRW